MSVNNFWQDSQNLWIMGWTNPTPVFNVSFNLYTDVLKLAVFGKTDEIIYRRSEKASLDRECLITNNIMTVYNVNVEIPRTKVHVCHHHLHFGVHQILKLYWMKWRRWPSHHFPQ